MRTEDFQYHLPPELIAQQPAAERDASRLLVLDRKSREFVHRRFVDLLDYLRAGDLLVMNNSKVIPARLRATKPGSGGAVELLLVEEVRRNEWWVMLRPGKRVRAGTQLRLLTREGSESAIDAEVQEKSEEGHYRINFYRVENILDEVSTLGEIPLPPYITRPEGTTSADSQRYQTVYAGPPGSVAAPTAGLHFTPEMLERIRNRGIGTTEVTLHVGLGTFAPVKVEKVEEHRMHAERYEVTPASAALIHRTKSVGQRVMAIGTTSLRVLESASNDAGVVKAGAGSTNIFIYPPRTFKVVDALLTNFHLPESTLLMLVSAFASPEKADGRELILRAYAEAVREQYRFFSYGDAMLIL